MQRKRSVGAIVFFWIAAIAWGSVLFFFSGQNANESGRLSRWFTEMFVRVFPNIPLEFETLHLLIRKTAHFCIFALEGFLLGMALMLTLPKAWSGGVLAAVGCAGMAVLNELHQNLSEGRSCEVRDMIIDSSGSVTGVLVAALALWIVRRIIRRRNVIIS